MNEEFLMIGEQNDCGREDVINQHLVGRSVRQCVVSQSELTNSDIEKV